MKKILVLLIIGFLSIASYAQEDGLSDPEAYFSAMIVSDIEKSITWYVDVIGFEVLNKKEFPDAGFKQANLKRGNVLVELIEMDKAVSVEKAIPNYNGKTRIRGLFKIGFLISDFDEWIDHLTAKKAQFHGSVVTNAESGKRMVIFKDPDGNRIQFFEKG